MTFKHNINIQAALVAATIGAATIFGMYLFQKKRKIAIPKVWKPIGKVKNLYVYPLKSGRRVEIKTANCTEFGIESEHQLRDRCLIVYKEANKEYKTARTHPKIISIEVTTDDPNYLFLKAPGMDNLQLNISNLTNSKESEGYIGLWKNEKVFTIDCGDEAAQWVSKYVGGGSSSGFRLGFHDGLSLHRRTIGDAFQPFANVYPHLDEAAMGLYSDCSSYLLMNQSSVDELSSRIKDPAITVHNFRPNILVDGENIQPYAEDKWEWIKIGDVILHLVKPCARCSLTTINPETGLRCANEEPLRTLKTYRKVKDLTQVDLEGQDPIMGNYMRLRHSGQIKAGDTVFLGTN